MQVWQHLEAVGADISCLYALHAQWFLCCYLNYLPLEACLRVWDWLFHQRSCTVLFKVGEEAAPAAAAGAAAAAACWVTVGWLAVAAAAAAAAAAVQLGFLTQSGTKCTKVMCYSSAFLALLDFCRCCHDGDAGGVMAGTDAHFAGLTSVSVAQAAKKWRSE